MRPPWLSMPRFQQRALRYVASGWNLSSIYRYQTGGYIDIVAGGGNDFARNGTYVAAQRARYVGGDPDRTAEEAMKPGPTTFRPNELLAQIAFHLTQAGVKQVLVTTGDGELLGVLDRAEAIRRTGGGAAT